MDACASPRRYRAVFVSDLHLGAPACQAGRLLEFLRGAECDTLYLVGDIVDGWRLASSWRWPPSHDAVVRHVLGLAQRGTRVIYVPGNHDAFARGFYGEHHAGVQVAPEAVHEGRDGRRWLVVHGDLLEPTARRSRLQAVLGDLAYRAVMRADMACGGVRARLERPRWSLAGWLKGRAPAARRYVAAFEAAVAGEARRRGFDGVVCGHIHQAACREIDGVAYLNDGDWVESCTAAVETLDGAMELVRWEAPPARRAPRPAGLGARPMPAAA